MRKMHTRIKRMLGLSHNRRHSETNEKKNRAKTFSTPEAAKEHASKTGLKEGEYIIEPAKKNRRFRLAKK